MEHSIQVRAAASELRASFADRGLRKAAGVLAYAASFLPGLSIAGVADRYFSDAQTSKELTGLWELVVALNERVSELESLEDVIAGIATTVAENPGLQPRVQHLMGSLGAVRSEFHALAEDEGFQRFQRVLIEHEIVAFETSGTATTRLEQSDIRARLTRLRTSGKGSTDISDTAFRGADSTLYAVGNMTQTGNVDVTSRGWSSRGAHGGFLSGNGAAIKTDTPCPACGFVLKANPAAAITYIASCPNCNAKFAGRL